MQYLLTPKVLHSSLITIWLWNSIFMNISTLRCVYSLFVFVCAIKSAHSVTNVSMNVMRQVVKLKIKKNYYELLRLIKRNKNYTE